MSTTQQRYHVVPLHEDMFSLTNLPRGQRLRKIIQIQPSLLKQMNMDFAAGPVHDDDDEESHSLPSISMMISAQFFFTEMASEATSAEKLDDTEDEALSKKRKQADQE